MRKVILALRGFKDIHSLEDNRVFWNSFINLQKKLPSNIKIRFVLQNCKGKESKLYSFLFDPFLELDCNTDYLLKNCHNLSFDFKELKKNISMKKNISNQLIYSLKESFFISFISSYFANNKYKFDQLILINFRNIILNKSKPLFIYDHLLPLDKIYLRYSNNIDQGYSVNLIIIPKKFLEIFAKFNKFFLRSINKSNNFLNKYNIYGWPLSLRRKPFKEFLYILKKILNNFILNFFQLIENKGLKFTDIRILRFFVNKVRVFINIPSLTIENSFVGDSINQGSFIFKKILPIKSIFKYFIHQKNLRKDTRFISDNDFENYKDYFIIGKKDFILVLKDDFSINEKKIKYELYNLRLKPKFTIFVKQNKIIVFKYFPKTGRFLKEIFFKNKNNEYQNILCVLLKIKNINQFNYEPPILILNSLSSFKSCNDISYLNSLLQFFIWEDISYVSFQNTNSKNKYSEFPYLYSYSKNHQPNLDQCIINFKLLKGSRYKNLIELISRNYNNRLFLNNQKKLFL